MSLPQVTSARIRIDVEQRRQPPPPEASDRIAALVATVRDFLPPELLALVSRDDLAIGEVGEIHPDVRTGYPQGGYTIEFTTGMMIYTQLIASYASGTFIEGAIGAPQLDLDNVKTLVAAAMKTYVRQSGAIWQLFAPKFKQSLVPVSDSAAKLRDQLLDCTRIFLLTHEIGHVAMAAGVRPRGTDNEEETRADGIGLELALAAATQRHNWRVAIAGAAMAIRLFVSLERFGVRFSSDYPPQEARLAMLEATTRSLLGSAQRADERSTVMVAILDLMDDLDARILGRPGEVRYTESRARIGLLARLIEVGHDALSAETFVAMTQPYAAQLDKETFARVLNALCDYYWPWAQTQGYFIVPDYLATQTTLSHFEVVAMSKAIREITTLLPAADAALLDAKYRPSTTE